ncbi:MAG: polysaccharide biosynthesis C-terminal domain-containing protein [Chitinophagales bacterium]|nr:polysaccharide biosynthesis C-terminal domain-containing protein [Chitinophagales bacterium]
MDGARAMQAFQLLRFGGQMLVNILLTKSALGLRDIGLFDTFLFVTTSISFFWIAGITNSLMALYPKREGEERKLFLFNAFFLLVIANLLICIAFGVFSNQLMSWVYPEGEFPHKWLLLLFLLFNNPSFLIEHILYLEGKPKLLFIYGTGVMLINVFLVLLPVWLGYGLQGALLGLVVFAILKFVLLLAVLTRNARFQVQPAMFKEHSYIALPLALSIFVSGAGDLVDGYLVSTHFDKGVFAIFRYGARELPFAIMLANAFSTAAILHVAKDLETSLPFIKQRARQMMHLLFPITIILMLTSKWLYVWVFRDEFVSSAPVFNIYLLLLVSRMVFPQTILNGLKQTRPILIFALMEISLNVLLSIVFIQWWGILGVACATVISSYFDKACLVSYNWIKNGITPTTYIDLRWWLAYTVLLFFVYGFSLTF